MPLKMENTDFQNNLSPKKVVTHILIFKLVIVRKLIDEKVDWWESWLMRKSIDEKGELGFEDGQMDR